jgi:SAM-dependent methyltransferase
MVALAPRAPRITFLLASAEQLPFGEGSFDGLTVSSGVHWFDQVAFYAEAHRVLRDGGWLAIYDHYFMGQVDSDPSFADWSANTYLKSLPAPPRGPTVMVANGPPTGFTTFEQETFDDPISMQHDGIVGYLLTQSNCLAALQDGQTTLEDLRHWLTVETAKFFPRGGEALLFGFGGKVLCLRRVAE